MLPSKTTHHLIHCMQCEMSFLVEFVVTSVRPFCVEPSPPIELTLIDQAITSTGLTALFKVSPEGQDDVTGYILRAVSTDSSVDSKMEIKLQPTGRFVCMRLSTMCELVCLTHCTILYVYCIM